MVDLEALTPAELARQLDQPEGEVGLVVAESLNTINRWVNEAVFRRLDLEPGSRVLELGFGNGHLIPVLMRHARGIRYVGIDKSPTMADEALRFNRTLVTSGRAAFHRGSAEDMPFPDNSFDRAFGAGVVYFWAEPVETLAEIRRVLRSGGRSLLASMPPEVAETEEFARSDFGFHVYDGDTLMALHQAAGFRRVAVETYEEPKNRSDGSTGVLRVFFTIAES
jgi:ubiquinone/menaquinone biosynthesis C-methylase UbiE